MYTLWTFTGLFQLSGKKNQGLRSWCSPHVRWDQLQLPGSRMGTSWSDCQADTQSLVTPGINIHPEWSDLQRTAPRRIEDTLQIWRMLMCCVTRPPTLLTETGNTSGGYRSVVDCKVQVRSKRLLTQHNFEMGWTSKTPQTPLRKHAVSRLERGETRKSPLSVFFFFFSSMKCQSSTASLSSHQLILYSFAVWLEKASHFEAPRLKLTSRKTRKKSICWRKLIEQFSFNTLALVTEWDVTGIMCC